MLLNTGKGRNNRSSLRRRAKGLGWSDFGEGGDICIEPVPVNLLTCAGPVAPALVRPFLVVVLETLVVLVVAAQVTLVLDRGLGSCRHVGGMSGDGRFDVDDGGGWDGRV